MKPNLPLRLLIAAALLGWPEVFTANTQAAPRAQQAMRSELIFPLQQEHAHGATIVELADSQLLAAWFQGHGERWADDVRIMGARLLKDKHAWSQPFVLADVPDFPDINPTLFLDHRKQLWLVWYTVIANQWETSLIKYRLSDNYQQQEGPPEWKWQDVLHVKPGGPTERGIQPDDPFVASVKEQQDRLEKRLLKQGLLGKKGDKDHSSKRFLEWQEFRAHILALARGENMLRRGRLKKEDGSEVDAQLGYPYFRRMGWQTKNKAISIGDRLILPLYSDGLEMSLMAITDDFGKHWKFSTPLVGIANIQPSIARKKNGTLVAYMRDNGPPPQRHPMSSSTDQGLTWSPVVDSVLPNEGSGSDVVTLQNGHWAIAYNDTEQGRYSLAISLSTDEGKTWPTLRHLEQDLNQDPNRRSAFAYPSIIQGQDGTIHVVYSLHKKENQGESIKHVAFSEAWIAAGE